MVAPAERETGWRAPVVACLVAATATFAFDVAVGVARDWQPHPLYAAVCGALQIASALAVGLALGWTRSTPLVLAAWIVLSAAIEVFLYTEEGPLQLVAFGVVTWAAIALHPKREERAGAVGLAVAVGVAFCAVILPRLFAVLGMSRPVDLAWDAVVIGSLGLVVASFSLWARLREARPRLPSEGALAGLALAALVVPIPWALSGPDTQERIEVLGTTGESGQASTKPHVILLVLDTVRADRLSLYGYERDTTPHLRAFAQGDERVAVFPMAFSTSNWTLPAHASLFTGMLPSHHGAHAGHLRDLRHQLSADQRLSAESTLAESLRDAGYRTAAVLANAQVVFYNGMDRGFDQIVRPQASGWLSLTGERIRYVFANDMLGHLLKPYPDGRRISEELLRFLDDCGPSACFAVGNFMEAHWPYRAPPPWNGRFEEPGQRRTASDLYDEELLALDALLGDFLSALEERQLLDRSWLVITADHGEAFGENGAESHGDRVYNTEVRIPLIVRPPAGQRIDAAPYAVSLMDVTATLSSVAGSRRVGAGRDLRDVAGPQPVRIEFFGSPRENVEDRTPARAVVVDRDKLIERKARREFFRLDEDPHEERDQAAGAPENVAALTPLLPPLESHARPLDAPQGEAELTEQDLQRLEALGYID